MPPPGSLPQGLEAALLGGRCCWWAHSISFSAFSPEEGPGKEAEPMEEAGPEVSQAGQGGIEGLGAGALCGESQGQTPKV